MIWASRFSASCRGRLRYRLCFLLGGFACGRLILGLFLRAGDAEAECTEQTETAIVATIRRGELSTEHGSDPRVEETGGVKVK